MPDRKAELVEAWLTKAKDDLENARLLIREEKRLLGIAVYHCQQSAEKSLKAFLTRHDCVFPKTHILEKLLDLCLPLDPAFERFRSPCEHLTPLAYEYRYPGDADEPTSEEAAEAVRMAEEIFEFCELQLRE